MSGARIGFFFLFLILSTDFIAVSSTVEAFKKIKKKNGLSDAEIEKADEEKLFMRVDEFKNRLIEQRKIFLKQQQIEQEQEQKELEKLQKEQEEEERKQQMELIKKDSENKKIINEPIQTKVPLTPHNLVQTKNGDPLPTFPTIPMNFPKFSLPSGDPLPRFPTSFKIPEINPPSGDPLPRFGMIPSSSMNEPETNPPSGDPLPVHPMPSLNLPKGDTNTDTSEDSFPENIFPFGKDPLPRLKALIAEKLPLPPSLKLGPDPIEVHPLSVGDMHTKTEPSSMIALTVVIFFTFIAIARFSSHYRHQSAPVIWLIAKFLFFALIASIGFTIYSFKSLYIGKLAFATVAVEGLSLTIIEFLVFLVYSLKLNSSLSVTPFVFITIIATFIAAIFFFFWDELFQTDYITRLNDENNFYRNTFVALFAFMATHLGFFILWILIRIIISTPKNLYKLIFSEQKSDTKNRFLQILVSLIGMLVILIILCISIALLFYGNSTDLNFPTSELSRASGGTIIFVLAMIMHMKDFREKIFSPVMSIGHKWIYYLPNILTFFGFYLFICVMGWVAAYREVPKSVTDQLPSNLNLRFDVDSSRFPISLSSGIQYFVWACFGLSFLIFAVTFFKHVFYFMFKIQSQSVSTISNLLYETVNLIRIIAIASPIASTPIWLAQNPSLSKVYQFWIVALILSRVFRMLTLKSRSTSKKYVPKCSGISELWSGTTPEEPFLTQTILDTKKDTSVSDAVNYYKDKCQNSNCAAIKCHVIEINLGLLFPAMIHQACKDKKEMKKEKKFEHICSETRPYKLSEIKNNLKNILNDKSSSIDEENNQFIKEFQKYFNDDSRYGLPGIFDSNCESKFGSIDSWLKHFEEVREWESENLFKFFRIGLDFDYAAFSLTGHSSRYCVSGEYQKKIVGKDLTESSKWDGLGHLFLESGMLAEQFFVNYDISSPKSETLEPEKQNKIK